MIPDQDIRFPIKIPNQEESRFPIKIHLLRSSVTSCDLLRSLVGGVESETRWHGIGVEVGGEDGGVSVIGGGAELRTFGYRQAGCIGTGGVNRDTFHLVLATVFLKNNMTVFFLKKY